ncbi:MAG: periplasmic divalent cation tolerance protein [Zhongshania aliphaticivorans]|jgi:periplasmic divalent cation tolerance protein
MSGSSRIGSINVSIKYMETSLMIGWTTVDSEAVAESLARGIIEQEFAACVQIDNAVQSVYRWEGAVQSEREWRLMIKFTAEQSDPLSAYIKANHPYDVPEWVVISADQVAPDYLKWAQGVKE